MSFPAYEEYKNSGVDWVGEIPMHWEIASLKRGYAVTLGKMLQSSSKTLEDEKYPYLRAANIQWEGVDTSDIKEMWFSPTDMQNLQLEAGDLLVSEGGDVGRSCLWNAQLERCYFQNSVNRVRALGSHSCRYLFYWMATIKAKGFVEMICNKSTIAHFTAEKVASTPVPYPPPDEQRTIASFLDAETTKIDGLVSEQRRLIELLQEKRQAVISHAVTKGLNPDVRMKPSGIPWLGEVPEGWSVSRIKFMVQSNDGIQMGPFGGMLLDLDGEDTGYKVFGQENTITGDFTRGQRWISHERYGDLERYAARDGDLVLTRKGSLGNARLIEDLPQPGIIDSDTIRIRVDDGIVASRYLAKLLHEALYIAEQITRKKRGAILPGLNTGIIANLVVLLPNRDEQNELLSYLDSESERFDTLLAQAERAIELLQERRTALISAAVTGKIDVRGYKPDEAVA